MSISSTAVTPARPKKHIMGEESSNVDLKRRHQNRIAQRKFREKARARAERMSQTTRALANISLENTNETQSCLQQSSNNSFLESVSPCATMDFEELCHDSFQTPDLDPGVCNLFPEDQLNDSVGGIHMPQEYQSGTQLSQNSAWHSIMNGNHTMHNGDNIVNSTGDEKEVETESQPLHAGRQYNNLVSSDKLDLVNLDAKGQEYRENALATIIKQKANFQERGQLLIDDLEELYNFGVSLEILSPDFYFKRLLSTTKERFTSLSQEPFGSTYRLNSSCQ